MCSAASLAERTIAPGTLSPAESRAGSRPLVDLSPMAPHHAAGMRVDPAPSLAVASGTTPAITAAAEPAEEPPGVRSEHQGLTVGPRSVNPQVCHSVVDFGTEVRPMTTQPSRLSRIVWKSSSPSHALTPMGTPANRNRAPCATTRSISFASASACAVKSCRNARSVGSVARSRASAACMTSTAETSLPVTSSAMATASNSEYASTAIFLARIPSRAQQARRGQASVQRHRTVGHLGVTPSRCCSFWEP